MTDRPPIPNPGSDEAGAQGCRCPVLDNGRGRGYLGMAGVFVYRADCPLHKPTSHDDPSRTNAPDATP